MQYTEPKSQEAAQKRLVELDRAIAAISRDLKHNDMVARSPEQAKEYAAWRGRAIGSRKHLYEERALLIAWIQRSSAGEATTNDRHDRRRLREFAANVGVALHRLEASGVDLPEDCLAMLRRAEEIVPDGFESAATRVTPEEYRRAVDERAVGIEVPEIVGATFVLRRGEEMFQVDVEGGAVTAFDPLDAPDCDPGPDAVPEDVRSIGPRLCAVLDKENFVLRKRAAALVEKPCLGLAK